MNKKLVSLVLAASMLSAGGAAFAEEGIMVISENPTAEILEVNYGKVILNGIAKISEENELLISREGESDVVLNKDENTLFIDAEGNKLTIDEIKDGDSLKIVASDAMTRSLPPQTYAYVVIKATEEAEMPIYAEVESIVKEDDATFFFTKDGMYKITYSEETSFAPLATKNIVRADDITEGSRILVYSNMMTMSIPALVPADKIVILPEETVNEEVKPERVILNGNEIDAKIVEEDGIYFLPVRKICEAIGLDVQWNDSLKAVSIGTVQMGANFNVGVNSYKKARMMAQTLSAAPINLDGFTYAPIDFFTEILEAEVNNEDGAFVINHEVNEEADTEEK